MKYLIGGIIGFIIAVIVYKIITNKPKKEKRDIIAEQKTEYVRNIARLSEFIKDKTEVTNDDVEKHLAVSDATAERYLDDFEKAGKLIQIGKTGHLVKYKVLE